MKLSRVKQGFTLVELLIVLIVITILVMITATIYKNVQVQARDAQVHDAADKFADAILLWSAQKGGAMPKGGYTPSTSDAPSGDDCTTAAEGFQSYNLKTYSSTSYECTIGDSLVRTGYLTTDFFTQLPPNSNIQQNYSGIPNDKLNMFNLNTQNCPNMTKTWLLLYALDDPTPQDTSNFTSLISSCGRSSDLATWQGQGLRAARLIKFPS